MKYQDQKIRAIGLLTIVATVCTVLLALGLCYSEQMRGLVQRLPSHTHGKENILLAVLAIVTPIFWAVNLGLIFTSPAQEARFVEWSKRWRKTTIDFERIIFDEADPDYHKAAWRYFLDRYKD